MKRIELVGVGNCPVCSSKYYKWTNYEKLFGEMSLEDRIKQQEAYEN